MFQPDRKMRVQPYPRLATLMRTGSTNVALLACRDCLVGRWRLIVASLPTDRRGMHSELFGDANLAPATGQASLDLVKLGLSQLPVIRSHLRLNPSV